MHRSRTLGAASSTCSKGVKVHSTQDASLQIERLSSTNNFTAPVAGRFFRVMHAFGPAVSPRSTASARSHARFEGCRSMVSGSTVRNRPVASRFSLMYIDCVVTDA